MSGSARLSIWKLVELVSIALVSALFLVSALRACGPSTELDVSFSELPR